MLTVYLKSELNELPNSLKGIVIPAKNVEKAQLKIYNLKGQLVKIYKLESEDSSITWDGKNNNNLQVANGIYFYKLTCNNKSVVKKMIFLQ